MSVAIEPSASHATRLCAPLSVAVLVERRCSRGVQLRIHVRTAAEVAAEAWEAAVSASQRACAAVALGALRWSVAIEPSASHATLVCASLCGCWRRETVCSRVVQLRIHVRTAAEVAAEAWEAAVSASQRACGCGTWRPTRCQLRLSHRHRMRRACVRLSLWLFLSRDGAAAVCSSEYTCELQLRSQLKRGRQR